jgi:hypothetical protein
MEYIVKVTVSRDRDQSCNTYSLTESKSFGIDRPTPKKIRDFVIDVRERYIASYPTNQGKPDVTASLLPTDVEVIDTFANEKLAVAS